MTPLNQKLMKKHNFSAGPCILPQEVLKKASEALINFNNLDLSLIEISHRSADFVAVMEHAKDLVLELMELKDKGYTDSQFEDLREIVKGKDSDLYDVLSFIAYNKHLVPRLERAEKAKIQMLDYDAKQQAFLNFVLEQYVREGVKELDDAKLSELLVLKYHALADAKVELGSVKGIREMFIGFQAGLYGGRVG